MVAWSQPSGMMAAAPTNFEVEIGNRLVYAAPLHEVGAVFSTASVAMVAILWGGSPTKSAGDGARGMRPGFGSHPFLTEPGPVFPGL